MCPERLSTQITVARAINAGEYSAPGTLVLPPEVLLIYLHGFLSSPESKKAQQTLAFFRQQGFGDQVLLPQMRHGPAQTALELERLFDLHSKRKILLMGSSLGGFYASYFSEKYDIPAVLINPAVRPFELWETHLGEHKNYYTDEIHLVTREHIQELLDLDVSSIEKPQNFMVLVQTGDETLDYGQAIEKFAESNCVIRQNGSHSYENFEAELPLIFDFFLSRIDQFAR